MTDGNGGTVQATVDIIVVSVNDAPVATNDSFSTNEDVALTGEVLLNDSDLDGDTLVVNTTPVADPANGSVVLNGDGTFTYRPDANFFGSDSFTYEVIDGNGGTAQATVNINVVSVNDAPLATNDIFNTKEDVALTGDVLSNDSDVEGTLTVNTTPVADPTNGVVVLNADGTFTYRPDADFFGSDSFIYEVTDGNGGTAQATVDIIVVSVNDAPVVADDRFTTNEDVAFTGDVLANDSDALTVNTTPVTEPTNGSVALNADGTFTYTPNANFFGSDSFTYEVTDGNGETAQATVDIIVVSANDAPTNSAVTLTPSLEDNDRIITQEELLANANDIEGDVLTATNLTIASGNGILLDNGDGTWTYTPAANDDTSVSFSYNVTDGTDSVSGSATLDIMPDDDAPVFVNPPVSAIVTDQETAVADFGAIDQDGDQIEYRLVDAADEQFFVIDPSTGALQFVDLPTFENLGEVVNSPFVVEVAADDNNGGDFATSTIIVSVDQTEEINGIDVNTLPSPNTDVQTPNSTEEIDGEDAQTSVDLASVDSSVVDLATESIDVVAGPEINAPSSNDQGGADDFNYTEEGSIDTDLSSDIDIGLFESYYQAADFVQETELVSQQLADVYSSRRGGDDGFQADETQLAALFWQGLDSSNEEYLQRNFDADNANIVAASAGLFSAGLLFAVYGGSIAITTLATQLPAWKSLDISPLISAFDEDDESIHEIVDG